MVRERSSAIEVGNLGSNALTPPSGSVRSRGTGPGRLSRALGTLKTHETILFGLMIGAALALLSVGLYHEARGLRRLSTWEHSFAERRIDRVAEIMEHQLALAHGALDDNQPLMLSEYLSGDYMSLHYEHHMSYAMHLLRRGEVERFNQLRERTGFVLFDLGHQDLAGLDLSGANLRGVDLSGADLSGCDLSGADLSLASAVEADLSDTALDGADLSQANLTDAILTRSSGAGPSFRNAILVHASLVSITGMSDARFDRAVLAEANLCGSSFPGAVLDHANLSMASSVGANLALVSSMTDADLTGANLSDARLSPGKMQRAWIVNTTGLDEITLALLKRNGAVQHPAEILQLVDQRIIDGFRTQIIEDATIPAELHRSTLLRMLKTYYLQ